MNANEITLLAKATLDGSMPFPEIPVAMGTSMWNGSPVRGRGGVTGTVVLAPKTKGHAVA
ncbi:hypothetical protein [Chitiniphilus shinanonensis]|uniref:hypothetical protein n=1 Tax=Chitiniphilus shinanonensis TaxID=553088 RepID=UPI0030227C5A